VPEKILQQRSVSKGSPSVSRVWYSGYTYSVAISCSRLNYPVLATSSRLPSDHTRGANTYVDYIEGYRRVNGRPSVTSCPWAAKNEERPTPTELDVILTANLIGVNLNINDNLIGVNLNINDSISSKSIYLQVFYELYIYFYKNKSRKYLFSVSAPKKTNVIILHYKLMRLHPIQF
jgi:hypothetical protein